MINDQPDFLDGPIFWDDVKLYVEHGTVMFHGNSCSPVVTTSAEYCAQKT
jgi:hypothetical protein